MRWLKANTNLLWCAFYLPSPNHGDPSWMNANDADLEGWGFAPVYVGRQVVDNYGRIIANPNVNAAQGAKDGADACAKMAQAGFDKGCYVYLDLENGPPMPTAQREYVAAWVDAIVAGGYGPGVYCSFLFATQVSLLRPAARIWVFHVRSVSPHPVLGTSFATPDPATSGFAGAAIWQHDDEARVECAVAGAPLAVDLDSANSPDPSAP